MSDRHYRRSAKHPASTSRTAPYPPVSLLFAGLLSLAPSTANAIKLSWDAELSFTRDDNVTRAQRSADILDDQFYGITVGASFLQWLNANHRMLYRGFLRREEYNKYDGLSNTSAGGQITYQYRASGTFTAPTYAVFYRGVRAEYESELRDSDFYTLGASWRKPVTDKITGLISLSGTLRESDGRAFDTKEVSLLGNLDYALNERWTLYHTHNYLKGDIVSTVNPLLYPSLNIVNAAEVVDVDDAFPNTGATRSVYRLNAVTRVFTLGANLRIGEKHSLDISSRYAESRADAGIRYERWLHSIAYLTRF